MMGPAACVGTLLALMLLAALLQRLTHGYLDPLYRFVAGWAVLTVLDPVLILLVDLGYKRWEPTNTLRPMGDAFKLYYHFERSDDGGLPGAFLTLFLYCISSLLGVEREAGKCRCWVVFILGLKTNEAKPRRGGRLDVARLMSLCRLCSQR